MQAEADRAEEIEALKKASEVCEELGPLGRHHDRHGRQRRDPAGQVLRRGRRARGDNNRPPEEQHDACRGRARRQEALEAPGIARLSHRLRCVVNGSGLRHDWEGLVPPGPGKEFNPPGELAGEQTMHYPHGAGVVVCMRLCVCVLKSVQEPPRLPGGPVRVPWRVTHDGKRRPKRKQKGWHRTTGQ